ncbi:MAG: transcriptional regulator [Coriobacteriia bacterium]|nr:transcriptional regulator [Coriobacteriia bacterium]
MRKLSFKGFLARYLQELSGQNSLRLSHLARQAESENPRLREPLLLYAAVTGATHALLAALQDGKLKTEYSYLLTLGNLENLLRNDDNRLPERYRKVYRSYQSVRDRQNADDHTKQLMWRKVRGLQEKKRVSNYRVYTDLQLNPGNANAFLKHGDTSKLSLNTAREMLRYLEAA